MKRIASLSDQPVFFQLAIWGWTSSATQNPSIHETWRCLEMGYPAYRYFETHVIEFTPEMPLPQAALLTGKSNQKQRASGTSGMLRQAEQG